MKRFGLIGYPLGHSFSRKYFTDKFAAEKIDAVFNNYSIESLEEWRALALHEQLNGFAITIPHKRNILPFLDHQSAAVTEMNACNCVVINNAGWHGHNTDVTGFERSFVPGLAAHHSRALILGTGGAAAAVKYVLKRLKIAYLEVSRTKTADNLIYSELTKDLISTHSVIINCSPIGTFPDITASPAIPYEFITPKNYLFDLIYNPEETVFLKKGREAGATIKNGFEMLALQAEENWKIWNDEVIST